jgi:hypothetical protein
MIAIRRARGAASFTLYMPGAPLSSLRAVPLYFMAVTSRKKNAEL